MIVAICTRWQRARESTTWQAIVVVVPMRQHSCAATAPRRGRPQARRPAALERRRVLVPRAHQAQRLARVGVES